MEPVGFSLLAVGMGVSNLRPRSDGSGRLVRRLIVGLCVAVLATTGCAAAQTSALVVRARVGVDANNVGRLLLWQESERAALASRGIPLDETARFPAFLGGQFEAGVSLDTFGDDSYTTFGVEGGWGSTGGRLYYEDYSGVFVVDRTVRRAFAGVFAEYALVPFGSIQPHAGLHFRANATSVGYERQVEIDARTIESAEATEKGWSFGVEPVAGLGIEIAPRTSLRVEGGWEIGFNSEITYEDGALPPEAQGTVLYTGWGGPRVAVGVARQF